MRKRFKIAYVAMLCEDDVDEMGRCLIAVGGLALDDEWDSAFSMLEEYRIRYGY